MDDNLLSTTSNILYDGEVITADEEMTPTVERLVVLWWLTLIDNRLPAYASRIYAHDLAARSLKDLQPQICDAMDSLLTGLNSQETDVTVNYSRAYNNNGNNSV